MKRLGFVLILLFSSTTYAYHGAGALYCGKTESHIRIFYNKNYEIYHYEDNMDLNDIKSYPCVKFDTSLPFYNEIEDLYNDALTQINETNYNARKDEVYEANRATKVLKEKGRIYCGNPKSGGLYQINVRDINSSLYLFDIESQRFEIYNCIRI